MPVTQGFPGGQNVYLVSHEATGELTISYSRNPKDFPLLRYVTLTPITKQLFAYLKFNAQEAARIVNQNPANYVWADGAERPPGNGGLESFEWDTGLAVRYAFPFTLGRLTVDQATWPVVSQHAAFHAQQAMTLRTLLVAQILTAQASYPTQDVFNVATGYGKWNTGTTADPVIKLALNQAAQQIQINTLGVIKPTDLAIVVNPNLASAMAASSEVQDYVKQSIFSLGQLRGDIPSQNGQWGLPDTLYNYKVIVEDTVIDPTAKLTATANTEYVWPNTICSMVARPGALIGVEGTPSFSSVHLFMHEEMTCEIFDDAINRRVTGSIVENYCPIFVTNISAAYFYGCQ